jgi:hypothetical protein
MTENNDDDDDDVAETEPIGSGRLADLVGALNALPGITLLAQQSDEDAFAVFFDVEILAGGWLSLAAILQAIDRCDDGRDFHVYVAAGDDESPIIFQLEGDQDADPSKLAREIEEPDDPPRGEVVDDEPDSPLLGVIPQSEITRESR